MKDKNYDSAKADNSHYSVPSMYGKMVREQYNMRSKCCDPGKADGNMKAAHSDKQKGV